MTRRTRPRTEFKAWAIILNCVFAAVLVLVWPLVASSTFFLFDAPGSEENAALVGSAWAIWLFPIPTLTGIVRSFACYREKRFRGALLWCALPAFALLATVVVVVVLNSGCGGDAACP